MILNFRLMDEADARSILQWNYEPPLDFYNASLSSIEEDVRTMLDPQNCYYAIADEQNNLVQHGGNNYAVKKLLKAFAISIFPSALCPLPSAFLH